MIGDKRLYVFYFLPSKGVGPLSNGIPLKDAAEIVRLSCLVYCRVPHYLLAYLTNEVGRHIFVSGTVSYLAHSSF